MTDYFALLGQPRQPWLDPDLLRDAFHRRAATLHPDVAGTGDADAFAELNTAHSTLRDPATRLRHFLELEHPGALAAPREIPAALADLFLRIGGARPRLQQFLKRQSATSSGLARALLAGEKATILGEWSALRDLVEAAHAAQVERLQSLEPTGFAGGETLAEVHQQFAYLGRWSAQIREALFALAG